MPWAAHVLQWLVQKEAIPRGGANPQNQPQFGLESEIRLHEVGIASKAVSATTAWIRSRALYTPPVTSWKSAVPEVADLTIYLEEGAEGVAGN